jgi:hypothetical protein
MTKIFSSRARADLEFKNVEKVQLSFHGWFSWK